MSLGLESLDLDFQESKIYVILLALGPLSVGEIIKYAEFTAEDTLRSINELKTKGYIHEIPGITFRYHALIPFNDLKVSAQSTVTQMENIANQLDKHIADKLSIILGKLREESQNISEGFSLAENELKQSEIKGESDTEAKIAKYVLEVEQGTEQNKTEIITLFNEKQTNNANLISDLKNKLEEKNDIIKTSFQTINQEFKDKYLVGMNDILTKEEERSKLSNGEINNLISQSQAEFLKGIQNIHQVMEKTGGTLYQSIDVQNETITSQMSDFISQMDEAINKANEESGLKVSSVIDSYGENINNQIETSKNNAISNLTGSLEEIKAKTVTGSQDLQQKVNEILTNAQNQVTQILQTTQKTLDQTFSETRTHVDNSMEKLSEGIKSQTDNDFQKVIIDTETTFKGFALDATNLHEKTRDDLNVIFNDLLTTSKDTSNNIKSITIVELKKIVDNLKAGITSQLSQFRAVTTPQEQHLKDLFVKYQTDFTTSQNQALEQFKGTLEAIKSSIETKNREIEDKINQEANILEEDINKSLEELNTQIQEYDTKYVEVLNNTTNKGSEKLIAQARELQERAISTVNELAKIAINQLTSTNQLVTSSIRAEIDTLETELTDFSSRFKEVAQKNEEIFKNYLFSLEKLASLSKETKYPEVQTAPIVSKEATLGYIHDMFSRMKGGMTLLIPNINEIPIDLILATKHHQRVTLVTIIDPDVHADLLKKLFQKPNVRVRSVDTSRFPGVEQNIAADRDGEEVIIGIIEDTGQTVSIASLADAFINLMGKIVLGDFFLARSQEIKRIDVGM